LTPATPGIVDPFDYGAEIGDTIASGMLLMFFATGPGVNTATSLSLGFGSSALANYLPPDRVIGGSSSADADFGMDGTPLASAFLLTSAPGKVVAAFYPDNPAVPPTAGSVTLYVRIESA
jgi:hypothetical protein